MWFVPSVPASILNVIVSVTEILTIIYKFFFDMLPTDFSKILMKILPISNQLKSRIFINPT